MKEFVVRTIFFCSTEEDNLDSFIEEFIEICSRHKLNFNDICYLFERILSMPPEDDDFKF